MSILASTLLAAALGQAPVPDALAFVRPDIVGEPGPPFLSVQRLALGATQFEPIHATLKTFHDVVDPMPLRHVFAADVDGDGVDELVAVREKVAKHRLALTVTRAPLTWSEKAKTIASFDPKSLPPSTGDGAAVAFGRVDLEGDGRDEIAWIRRYLDGSEEIEIVRAPKAKNVKAKAPLAVVTQAGTASAAGQRAVFGTKVGGVRYLARLVNTEITLHALPAKGTAPLGPPLATMPIAVDASSLVAGVAPVARLPDGSPGVAIFRKGGILTAEFHRLVLGAGFDSPVASEPAIALFAAALRPRPPSPDDPPPTATFEITYWHYIGGGDILKGFEIPVGSAKATLTPAGWTMKLPGAFGSNVTLVPKSGAVTPSSFQLISGSTALPGTWKLDVITPGAMNWSQLFDGGERFWIGGVFQNVGTITELPGGTPSTLQHFILRRKL